MSDFVSLQDEVLSHQFSDSKYRAYIKQWLNEAQNYIVSQTDVRTQMATVEYTTEAGVNTLALPSDFSRIIRGEVERDVPYVEPDAYDALPDASGQPTLYTVIGTDLVLWPTPDAADEFLLRYYKLPAEMTQSSDEPEIPAQYHHLLVRYSLIRCYQRENDYEAANYFSGEFDKGIMKMRGEVQADVRDAPRQVPGSYANDPVPSSSVWW